MLKIQEAIVVEGRYDKNTLSQVVDAPIFETSGFGIFRDKPRLELLRKIAQNRGLIVLTDSDGAGFVIRNHLKSVIPSQYLKHAYIPDIPGKEKRKSAPGKEGKLGVEGMTPQIIENCLRNAGATVVGEAESRPFGQITKRDFMEMGLSGGANSSLLRQQLASTLQLPQKISANALLQALNLLYTRDEIEKTLQDIQNGNVIGDTE